ncbi:NAD(P)-binding domain [Ostreococcus tauri]|uniref:NAD(P)-binding domain n=1 Tax=Ostreococcus tauri TaxID=70448 RepID=Q014I3_OSTTA|nr:NAD(P)-binding domain [Ostreococcus tauri]CAL54696.1 NAD(P)-binding domain [Ostreococcus tauri]|eukprot:XP_003080529.1 NAD(P)-binding domain [Ostreococcus tauri]
MSHALMSARAHVTNVIQTSSRIRKRSCTSKHFPSFRAAAAASTSSAVCASFTPPGAREHDRDLLIVGPGVLGSRIARVWLEKYPGAVVVGQTNTTNAHAGLTSIGVSPRTKDFDDDEPSANRMFPYVIFSAPPSGSDDYAGEVEAALRYWNGGGAFAFTSSSAVYKNESGDACDEDSETYDLGTNPRVDRLLKAERIVLDAGGVVCRLAGLYHSDRGAHKYFIKTPSIDSRADALVNLIHYEDAADLCVAAMNNGSKSAVYLGTDGVPITRGDIARVAVESGAYGADARAPSFTKTEGPIGRVMSNDRTRTALGWAPKYVSFETFMTRVNARDAYSASEKRPVGWAPKGSAHIAT